MGRAAPPVVSVKAECKNWRPSVFVQVKATVSTEGGPMKVLKTIVATAVIVFALTTVAMAGVQHFTKQSGQATGSQAQTAQPTYTVTLTAAQLAQLMNGGKAAAARRRAARTADAAPRPADAAPRQGGAPSDAQPRRRRTDARLVERLRRDAPRRGHAPCRLLGLEPAAITPRRVITPAATAKADPAVTDRGSAECARAGRLRPALAPWGTVEPRRDESSR